MKQPISMIGVPMALGQRHPGVAMGPQALRCAQVVERLTTLGYTVEDVGDLDIPRARETDSNTDVHERLRHVEAVRTTNQRLAKTVSTQVSQRRVPLVLGGDHSIGLGTLAGLRPHYERLGVLWFDAHGDFNTDQTTPSGNIHGMPLAASLGYGHERLTSIMPKGQHILPEHVVLIGVRELDPGEKERLKQLPITVYTMHDIDRLGMQQVMTEAIQHVTKKTDGVHVSFDVDAIDPAEAPGVGTPAKGGFTYRESHLALTMLANAQIVTSAEFVELNPMFDLRGKTAHLTVDLIGALFGETFI